MSRPAHASRPSPLDQVTAYFITTDRATAAASLASLERQHLRRAIVVVRNVAPLSRAYAQCLSCATPYALLVDDDILLRAAVLEPLTREFEARRRHHPEAFWLHPKIVDQLTGQATGGVKLFYLPLLKRIGFPDASHVSFAQREHAAALGYAYLRSDLLVGTHQAGSLRDIYCRYLWLRLRVRAGQHGGIDLAALLQRAESEGSAGLWAACLGFLDGASVAETTCSKRDGVLGAVGRHFDFERSGATALRHQVRALLQAGQPGALGPSPPQREVG